MISKATYQKLLAFALGLYALSSFISMAVMSISAAIMTLACLLYWAQGNRPLQSEQGGELWYSKSRQHLQSYLRASLVLTFACLLSLIGARYFPLIYNQYIPPVSFLKDMAKTIYLFLPLILAWGLHQLNQNQKNWIVRIWVYAFLALSIVGIVQYFTGWPRAQMIPQMVPSPAGTERYHVILWIGHHLSVASILIFPFFFVLDLLRNTYQAQQLKFSRGFLVFTASVGLVALLGTFSRTLWIALPVGIFMGSLYYLPKKYRVKTLLITLVVGVIFSQLAFVQRRFSYDFGVNSRQTIWATNFEFFKKRPLTGTGWHHNVEMIAQRLYEKNPNEDNIFVSHAHNNFIDMLASTGLIGLLAWLIHAGLVVRLARVTGRQWLVCAWIVFHLNGLTQVNYWDSKVMHQMIWAIAWTLIP